MCVRSALRVGCWLAFSSALSLACSDDLPQGVIVESPGETRPAQVGGSAPGDEQRDKRRIQVWRSVPERGILLEEQEPLRFAEGAEQTERTIVVETTQSEQEIEGFGLALTQGSAQMFMSLPAGERAALLRELFHPVDGVSMDALRVTLGPSDLSTSLYSYNDTEGDVTMDHFSLEGPDLEHIVPVLQEIVALNPDIHLMASPWSAPTWMKLNGKDEGWRGGILNPDYYEAYARYFVAYFDAMEKHGIRFWALTPQNEPLNEHNIPSMLMSADEQLEFIDEFLGPALDEAGHNIKIIAYDHNLDVPEYPIQVANGSSYVSGSAFHKYAGDMSAMGYVREQTGKDVYFTEQYTSAEGDFAFDFGWHVAVATMESLQNGARAVIHWNLAESPARTEIGCPECRGALTLDPETREIQRHVSYYFVSQFSQFVDEGAVRLPSPVWQGALNTVAFRNPNDSLVLVAFNGEDTSLSVQVEAGDDVFSAALPAHSTTTFDWPAAP